MHQLRECVVTVKLLNVKVLYEYCAATLSINNVKVRLYFSCKGELEWLYFSAHFCVFGVLFEYPENGLFKIKAPINLENRSA